MIKKGAIPSSNLWHQMQDGKEYSGYSQSQQIDGARQQGCQATSSGSKGKKNYLTKPATCITKSSLPSRKKPLLEPAAPTSPTHTASYREARLLLDMCGRKTPQSPTPALNLAQNPSEETQRQTGNPFGPPPSPVHWSLSQPTSEFVIIGSYSRLLQITRMFQALNELVWCFGDELELVNLEVPGKSFQMLTLSVQGQNSGK